MSFQPHRFAGKPWWQISTLTGQPQLRSTEPKQPAKGDYNGICQRHDCSNPGAHWFNPSTGRYVCSSCARSLNGALKKNGGPPTIELHLSR